MEAARIALSAADRYDSLRIVAEHQPALLNRYARTMAHQGSAQHIPVVAGNELLPVTLMWLEGKPSKTLGEELQGLYPTSPNYVNIVRRRLSVR